MIPNASTRLIGQLLRNISQPARLKILLAIGEGEACVCHLEALLGYRQAYISQHLMAMRRAGILATRRDGRYIFYRLQDKKLLDVIRAAGEASGVPEADIAALTAAQPLPQCCCPDCVAEVHI